MAAVYGCKHGESGHPLYRERPPLIASPRIHPYGHSPALPQLEYERESKAVILHYRMILASDGRPSFCHAV